MLGTDGRSPPEEPLIPSGPFGVTMAPWPLPIMAWDGSQFHVLPF